ncbi:MAG: NAD(P)H-hydrate epimerase [Clostridiales bacterium]|nr:NAD(P)H-hydrate epimerase [Clostridiales bacterium]
MIITGTQAKAADIYAIETLGIPSLTLMENASREVMEYLASNYASASILILCGTGNNGADGVCIANLILNDKRFALKPTVLILGSIERASWEFLHQLSQLRRSGGNFRILTPGDSMPEAEVLVDAIFGIGLRSELRESRAAVLGAVDAMSYRHVIAVDIPSGINSDTGELMGAGIHANTTITFGCMKTGLVNEAGKEYAGEVIVKDIGIPQIAYTSVI